MDWLDLLAVQGTLKGLLQHHSSKAWWLFNINLCNCRTKVSATGFFFCIDVSLIGSLLSTLHFNDGRESSENNLNTRQIVITNMMGRGIVSILKTPSFLACQLLTGQLSFIHSLYFRHLIKKDDGNHLGKACLNVSLKWS